MQRGRDKWNAEDYAEYSAGQEEWAHELVAKLSLQGHESILDVGCGDGKISAHLANFVSGSVLGIDSSPSMILLARRCDTAIAVMNIDGSRPRLLTDLDDDDAFQRHRTHQRYAPEPGPVTARRLRS